jgi:hypothetical protein
MENQRRYEWRALMASHPGYRIPKEEQQKLTAAITVSRDMLSWPDDGDGRQPALRRGHLAARDDVPPQERREPVG